ncbi:uncharacterized protein METZ01_LOCUS33474 [marine metagenome]|uniref:DUF721 domain-containing protein n=1 Tax=marine metagenome TaxID=408172 RepID=A0A381QNJ0_9ZZZZ
MITDHVSENKLRTLLRRKFRSDTAKSPLYKLLHRALDQEHKTKVLRSILPRDMASQFEVASVRGNKLTIHAKNASWATRLRFDTPRLLNQLCDLQEFSQIQEIQIRSVSSLEASPAEQSVSKTLSTPTSEPLDELADRTEQGELKRALRNLAQHGRRNSTTSDPNA